VLEEFVKERGRFIRDADDLVRCLAIEFEIELGPGLAVIPGGQMFEITPPQRALRERGASDGEADTGCLPGEAVLLRDRFGKSDNAARDEALSAFVLARENENGVAFGDMLAAIHRLLRGQRERFRPWIANLGFDRERHVFIRTIERRLPSFHRSSGAIRLAGRGYWAVQPPSIRISVPVMKAASSEHR
jgi:hypothetical protein